MKKYLISLLYILISFILLIFLLTLISYFDVVKGTLLKIIKIIIPIVSVLIGGIKLGKSSLRKGYLEGIKLGSIFVILIFIFSFLGLDKSLNWTRLIYYLIIIVSSMFGSMLGINKKNT